MGGSVAAKACKVDRGLKSPGLQCMLHCFAGLVGYGTDSKTSTAVLDHLWHEGHPIQASFRIQSAQDLLSAANLHDIAGAKTRQDPGHDRARERTSSSSTRLTAGAGPRDSIRSMRTLNCTAPLKFSSTCCRARRPIKARCSAVCEAAAVMASAKASTSPGGTSH